MRAINQPAHWWGWHWEPPAPLSIIEIIRAGSMSSQLAALLWVGMERGASLIVAAEPPLAGKTTTLTALLSLTPPQTAAYFTRGQGEPFALPARQESHFTYLLVNEMSDHLPVYTWDEYARRAFELLAEGYSLATTMHAEDVDGILAQLENDLRIPRRQIANLTFIIPLYLGQQGSMIRRVREVDFLRSNGDDIGVSSIARWDSQRDEFELFPDGSQREAFARWAGLSVRELESEVRRREAFLERLSEDGTVFVSEVNAAIEGYYGEVIRAPSEG